MGVANLRKWLAEPRQEVADAVAGCVRRHVAALKSRGVDFYGYALLPGEPYEITGLVAVTNTEADIEVGPDDDQYRYSRYCVDEWAHWEHDGFAEANARLAEANARFASMHTRAGDGEEMDEFEVAHSDALLAAVVDGLAAAKDAGVLGGGKQFLAVWISDSDHPIMAESVKRLNTKAVARAFMAEFG